MDTAWSALVIDDDPGVRQSLRLSARELPSHFPPFIGPCFTGPFGAQEMARSSFSSDVTAEQWKKIVRLLPAPGYGGRPRTLDMREVVNAILFQVTTGCGWRHLPSQFPNRSSIRT